MISYNYGGDQTPDDEEQKDQSSTLTSAQGPQQQTTQPYTPPKAETQTSAPAPQQMSSLTTDQTAPLTFAQMQANGQARPPAPDQGSMAYPAALPATSPATSPYDQQYQYNPVADTSSYQVAPQAPDAPPSSGGPPPQITPPATGPQTQQDQWMNAYNTTVNGNFDPNATLGPEKTRADFNNVPGGMGDDAYQAYLAQRNGQINNLNAQYQATRRSDQTALTNSANTGDEWWAAHGAGGPNENYIPNADTTYSAFTNSYQPGGPGSTPALDAAYQAEQARLKTINSAPTWTGAPAGALQPNGQPVPTPNTPIPIPGNGGGQTGGQTTTTPTTTTTTGGQTAGGQTGQTTGGQTTGQSNIPPPPGNPSSSGNPGSTSNGSTFDLLNSLTQGAQGQGAGSNVQNLTQQKTLDLLNNPSPYGQQDVKDLYSWLGGNIDDQYALQRNQLGEQMAKRGLGASTIYGGNLNDLNIGQRSAQSQLGENLAQNYAQTLGNYQQGAINTGNTVGSTAQGNQQSWLAQLMGFGQNAFNNDLATNQQNQNASQSYQNYILSMLGLGYSPTG